MKRKWTVVIWIAAIVLAFTALYVIYSGNRPDQGTAQGKSAASNFTLPDLSGKKVSLSDYKGKIVFLNFWATWCKYCVMEMPELNSLNEEFLKGKDAVIVTVDVGESREQAEKFMKDRNFSLPVLLDADGSVSDRYGVDGFPNTFVIDRDGSVRDVIAGATTRETLLQYYEKYK